MFPQYKVTKRGMCLQGSALGRLRQKGGQPKPSLNHNRRESVSSKQTNLNKLMYN